MYRINESVVIDENKSEFKTYGITYQEKAIRDISINKIKIEKLIMLCNNLELSPLHLMDIVDDFLVDFKI